MIQIFHISFAVLAVYALAACANVLHQVEAEEVSYSPLDALLAESSGLSCDGRHVYTINDSANPADVYQINEQGQVTAQFSIPKYNHDWEALASDGKTLYIGDIGNNGGNRRRIQIHRVPLDSLFGAEVKPLASLQLTYTAMEGAGKQRAYAHDFDAEALVARKDDLLLFSKSWSGDKTWVYKIDKLQTKQAITPFASLDTKDWLVTGASLDPQTEEIVLVGYMRSGLPFFRPLMARVSPDLTHIETTALAGGQVEGVCVLPDGEILYTQERSLVSKAGLYRIHQKQDQVAQASNN